MRVGVFGSGGVAHELAWHLDDAEVQFSKEVYSKDFSINFLSEGEDLQENINGYQVISERDFLLNAKGDTDFFAIAIGMTSKRQQLVQKSKDRALVPVNIISKFARIGYSTTMGEGAILCPGVILMPGVTIGDYFQGHLNSYVAHDCVIGDFVTLLPGVICSGRVEIQNNVTIGAGAVIKNGSQSRPLTIGEGATIGMGAIVTKDVPSHSVVVGNPAKVLKRT